MIAAIRSARKDGRLFGGRRALAVAGMCMLLGGCMPAASNAGPVLTVWGAVFYSVSLTMIGAFYLINVALKNMPGIHYSTLFVLYLALVWSLEGGLGEAGVPANIEVPAGLTLAFVMAAFGLFTAENAIDPRREMKRTRRAMKGLIIVCLALVAVAWAWPSPGLRYVANVMLGLMVVAQYVSTRTWQTHDDRQKTLPLMVILIGGVLLLGVVVMLTTGIARPFTDNLPFHRIVFAAITFPTMLAVVAALIDMRKARDTAMQASLEAARRDAETSASLLEMEKNYARARDVAASRTRQLSTASHDIRQPIASMRAEIDALRRDAPGEVLARLEQVLDHMDSLTGELSRAGTRPDEAGLHGEMDQEVLPVSLLFATLERMFRAEAASAGIALRMAASGASVVAPPLALIRLTGNLISNAIAHARPTTILVGVRKRGNRLRLDVIDDGAGFEGGVSGWAFESGARSGRSEGSGLGLSIVRELSEAYDMPVEVRTAPGQGSRVSIWLSRA